MVLSEVVGAGGYFNLVPLVVFIPILGLLINIVFGGRMGEKLIGTVASLGAGGAFVIAVLQTLSLIAHPEGAAIPLADWITIGDLQLQWAFRVDTLSATMMLVVSGVGTLIHIYAIGYMHEDVRHNGDPGRFRRFFVFLNLFIAMMMILVTGDNYLMLFVGWEGVGLCSFLLIGFWYDKGKDSAGQEHPFGNAIAAKKAFITNRVGDFGFLLAAFTMFVAFRSFDFNTVFAHAGEVEQGAILAITLFMLLGVAGKSAQIPLYVWLPDAMAGPTPVSALIHAATMVTAGVYLVARSAPLYTAAPSAQTTVALVGGATALFAATIAVGQFDIKRVLAYSTISQLGFMVAAVGMGAFVAGMFHLVTHAFFKALLFLSSGSVIQGVERGHHHVEHDPQLKKKLKPEHGHHFDPQDMRNMGGLRTQMPVTFWVYLIGALALGGIFPLAGFWSKDEILAEALHLKPLVFWLLLIAAFFTAFYMGRQIFMVFFGQPRSEAAAHAVESPPVMTAPLIILAILSVIGGALNLPAFHTFTDWLGHTTGLGHAVEPAGHEDAIIAAGAEAAKAAVEGGFNPMVAIGSTLLAVGAITLSWIVYSRIYRQQQSLPAARRPDDPLRPVLGIVFTGMERKWLVDELYELVILNPYITLSRFLAEVIDWRFWHDWFHDRVLAGGYRWLSRGLALPIDLGIIDGAANGLAAVTQGLAARARRLQNGFVRSYAMAVFIGMLVILGYLIVRLS
jgi:NADH-quinone oxidoreductase subunit L